MREEEGAIVVCFNLLSLHTARLLGYYFSLSFQVVFVEVDAEDSFIAVLYQNTEINLEVVKLNRRKENTQSNQKNKSCSN